MQVASKITDPVEYIDSLHAMFNLVRPDRDERNKLVMWMSEAVRSDPFAV